MMVNHGKTMLDRLSLDVVDAQMVYGVFQRILVNCLGPTVIALDSADHPTILRGPNTEIVTRSYFKHFPTHQFGLIISAKVKKQFGRHQFGIQGVSMIGTE